MGYDGLDQFLQRMWWEGEEGNVRDCHRLSNHTLNIFTDEALTISFGNLFQDGNIWKLRAYQKRQGSLGNVGTRFLFSQIFKPITTARRQVTMKEIACTIERVACRVSINIVDRAGVRLIKTIDTWKGRGSGRRSNSPSYSFNNTFLHRRLTTCRSYWFEKLWKQIPLSRRCPDFLVFFGMP